MWLYVGWHSSIHHDHHSFVVKAPNVADVLRDTLRTNPDLPPRWAQQWLVKPSLSIGPTCKNGHNPGPNISENQRKYSLTNWSSPNLAHKPLNIDESGDHFVCSAILWHHHYYGNRSCPSLSVSAGCDWKEFVRLSRDFSQFRFKIFTLARFCGSGVHSRHVIWITGQRMLNSGPQ